MLKSDQQTMQPVKKAVRAKKTKKAMRPQAGLPPMQGIRQSLQGVKQLMEANQQPLQANLQLIEVDQQATEATQAVQPLTQNARQLLQEAPRYMQADQLLMHTEQQATAVHPLLEATEAEHITQAVQPLTKNAPQLVQAEPQSTEAEPHTPEDSNLKLDFTVFPKPAFFQGLKEALFGKKCIFDCIQIEVSSFCGGHCVYCPHTTAKTKWRSRHMTDATFKQLWPLMRQSRRVHLQGWGEPFLHPRFLDYVRVARNAGCRVSSTTCGLHMNDALARSLVKSGIDVIAFSLTGTDAESNAMRDGVPFEKVMESIDILQFWRKRMQGVHLEVHLAYLMFAPSMRSLRGLPNLMVRHGIHATTLSTLDYLALPEHAELAFAPHEHEKIAKAAALIKEVRKEIEAQGSSLHAALPAEQPAPVCRENIARTAYIDADGLMSPCIYLNVPIQHDLERHRVMGDINIDDPLALWESQEYVDFRDAISTETPDTLCVSCPKRHEAPY